MSNLKREDDFKKRSQHLKGMSDEQLKNRFWELAEKIVDPLLALGKENTTPSIERSVLLRMGFSSVEAMAMVNGVIANGLIEHGVGHVVYKLSKSKNISIREAGLKLYNNECWADVAALFKGE